MDSGIPSIQIVGMPDASVLEARHRVRCALKACGYEIPRLRVTVNLSPSSIRKCGTAFDLPIAVAILACSGQIPRGGIEGCLFVGELGLDGRVQAVRGSLAFGMLASREGLSLVSALEGGGGVGDERARGISSLSELRRGVGDLPHGVCGPVATCGVEVAGPDFSDVIDQELAKRAFVIAATGGHGLLMVGPPGSGKTMLARRMPGILPPLGQGEMEETLVIHSVAGLPIEGIAGGERPFRAPHHSSSIGGLIGGGRPVMPGEITLAHNGVLFLDELPEFATNVLQSLRQPLEDHVVRLTRVDGTYVMPCRFQLVAAANPCPCGHYGDPDEQCQCTPGRISAYQGRVGGPIMDRMDMVVHVNRPGARRVIDGEPGLCSHEMAELVCVGRDFSSWRASRQDRAGQQTVDGLGFDPLAKGCLERIARSQRLGGRSIMRLARVARTVADLGEREMVSEDDVMEASAFRGTFEG